MQQAAQPGRQDEWKEGGLYMTVLGFLPDFRTKRGKLDVRRLGSRIGKSAEAIYRWFRRDDLLDLDNARALITVASSEENVAALAQLNRRPPTLDDLIKFV
jgi:hypothetical protein